MTLVLSSSFSAILFFFILKVTSLTSLLTATYKVYTYLTVRDNAHSINSKSTFFFSYFFSAPSGCNGTNFKIPTGLREILHTRPWDDGTFQCRIANNRHHYWKRSYSNSSHIFLLWYCSTCTFCYTVLRQQKPVIISVLYECRTWGFEEESTYLARIETNCLENGGTFGMHYDFDANSFLLPSEFDQFGEVWVLRRWIWLEQ